VFLSNHKPKLAAVGSLTRRQHLEARDSARVFGGLRCASLKAGTVMTALLTGAPKWRSLVLRCAV